MASHPQLDRQGVDLTLDVQSANRDRVCLKAVSSMAISHQGNEDKTGAPIKVMS